MKIRSNIIDGHDIGRASNAAGTHFIDSNAGFERGWYIPIREFTPRGYARGYEFFLSGSSPYNAAHQSRQGGEYEKAATWDEWGVVIAILYDIDPDAQIGHYTSRADFIARTADEATRIRLYHDADSYYGRTHTAPWLQAA
jgi:hypothetical protein